MKTIKEWLELLNEPERSEALENLNHKIIKKNKRYHELWEAIMFGFEWSKTIQGHNYWSNIHRDIFNHDYIFNHENKLHS